jgi:hypothetical protein
MADDTEAVAVSQFKNNIRRVAGPCYSVQFFADYLSGK